MCAQNKTAEPAWATLPRDLLERVLALRDFLLNEARMMSDVNRVISEFAYRLRGLGVPLERMHSSITVLHAEYAASTRVWVREGGVDHHAIAYSEAMAEVYARSPMADAHQRGEWIELWLADTPDERYGVVAELKSEKFVHYLCAPISSACGLKNSFTFATRASAGFSPTHIAILRAVFPAAAACQEVFAMNQILRDVTRTYVGREPQQRILAGDVRRGEVMGICSAILFADMRRFTELTSAMTAERAAELLNCYYDCVVPPIEQSGGEVLKFIGDGILAIFRTPQDKSKACQAALMAAQSALRAVAERLPDNGVPKFEVGISLHYGNTAFGNVGSGERLDYTVIGRDVNLAARIASLCGHLGRPLLLSAQFRNELGDRPMRSHGHHAIKGLAGAEEVFEP